MGAISYFMGRGYLSGESRSESLLVELISLDEGGEVVGIGGWHYVERVFIKVQICLLSNSKTYLYKLGTRSSVLVLLYSRDLVKTVATYSHNMY